MTITLTWEDNPQGDLISHYNVYQNYNGGMQEKIGETDVATFEVVDPVPGSYVFNVSAVNLAGEGPQSVNAVGPALPTAPQGLVIEVV